MGKEKEKKYDQSGFSEKELDLAVDKSLANDQAKGGNIFDPKKAKQPQK